MLADYREVRIMVRLSPARTGPLRRADRAFATRFLQTAGHSAGFRRTAGRQFLIERVGQRRGRKAMLAHREARSLAYGTDGKLRVLDELLGAASRRTHADLH